MSERQPCPHETRPGTTVCLHCRHAAREAERAKFWRGVGRVVTGVVILATAGAAVSAGVTALRERPATELRLAVSDGRDDGSSAHAATPSPAQTVAIPVANDRAIRLDSLGAPVVTESTARADSSVPGGDSATTAASSTATTLAAADSASASASTSRPAPASTTAAPPAAIAPRLVPAIAEGRTELGDSVFALRSGEVVTVHFDTQLGRTRRHDKFDRMVRQTLPRIYGPAADSVLADIPVGGLTSTGDLLDELPNTGIRVVLENGSTLSIWPRTRPGRDGPLVIAYRAVVSR